MHLDISRLHCRHFFFWFDFFLSSPLFTASTVVFPPLTLIPTFSVSCLVQKYVCTHTSQDLTNATEETKRTCHVSGRAGSGLAPEESEG